MSKLEEIEKRVAFQERLEDLINEDGTKKAQLHTKIGIAKDTLTKAVKYGIVPKVITLIHIADYFNVSIDYLICKIVVDNFTRASINKTFNERLRELKKAKGIETDYELAKNTYLPRQYFFQWEKNNYVPSLENIEYLADYFGVSIDYLLGRSD